MYVYAHEIDRIAVPPKPNESNPTLQVKGMLSLFCLTYSQQQSNLHLNLKSSVSLKLSAMILATILFVLSTGSAVLADGVCEPDNKFAWTIPFSIVPKEFVYCATQVTGQNKQFCGLQLVSTDGTNVVLNGSYYDETGTGTGYYTFNLTKESNGFFSAKYATTAVPSTEGQTLTTYITQLSGFCMIEVKCFQGGPWAGSENSGTFSAVICPTQQDCDNGFFGVKLLEGLKGTAGPEIKKPVLTKCPKF